MFVSRCLADQDDGAICREPATILDPQRGEMGCPAHRPPPRREHLQADDWTRIDTRAQQIVRARSAEEHP